MGRDRAPKYKWSRREGKDLYGTGGESLQRRLTQPPGQHGKARMQRRRESEYDKQLREKQKVKRMYGLRETQFQRFFRMALRTREQTGLALLRLLERRLDNIIYRLGLARTRLQARQLVRHRFVSVDGEVTDIPSYIVKPGQIIRVKEKLLRIPDVQELQEANQPVPGWLARQDGGWTVVREPDREEIDQDIRESRIVEFYSR